MDYMIMLKSYSVPYIFDASGEVIKYLKQLYSIAGNNGSGASMSNSIQGELKHIRFG